MQRSGKQGDGGQQPERRADALYEGLVIAVSGGTVMVEIEEQAEGLRQIEVAATGFSVGDRVQILATPRAALTGAAALYLVPTALVIVGSFCGYAFLPRWLPLSADLGGLAGIVAALLLSLLFIQLAGCGRRAKALDLRLEKLS